MHQSVIDWLAAPRGLFIDGGESPASSGKRLSILNPARGEVLAEVDEAGSEDVDRAVAAASRAFEAPSWRRMPPSERQALLLRIASGIEAKREELGWIESLNNGKTLREGKGDVGPSADIFRYYAAWCRTMGGESIPVDDGDLVYTLREAVGVCAAIVPWNYPLLMAAWKIAPALACGCTLLLKPSEWTPLSALMLAEICKEAGLPPGVLNVLPGEGHTTGEMLARHPGIHKVAFTGSLPTARRLLMASAESNLKRLSLELGGKSPLVVFPDADLDAAVNAAFWGIFANKGEVCSASSRILVHEEVAEAFASKLSERAREMRVGDPLDPDTAMGALVHPRQLTKVLEAIESGKSEGAMLRAGGERLQKGELAQGYFVAPTVFDHVRPEMRIAREEIFGPVLAILRFREEAEAIRIANSTVYGLVAAVFTRDIARAHRVARALSAGVVWINRWNGFDSAAPFGGVKQSGWGREMGQHALELYTQTKCIWVAASGEEASS